MKKRKLAVIIAAFNASLAVAGGLLTNTNQSVHFLRNPARDASTSIDAVYTNPAALIKLENGLHFSINNQSAFQTRTITSTYAPFAFNGGSDTKEFEGKASAPIIPSVMGVYRVGDWALSGSISVVGGGGKATFNHGLPSFEAQIAGLPALLTGNGIPTTAYSVDQYMEGSSIIYGAQLGGTYKINEMFSAYAGFRLNIVSNGYTGHLKNIQINPNGTTMPANTFFTAAANQAQGAADQLNPVIAGDYGASTLEQLVAAGVMPSASADALAQGLGVPKTTTVQDVHDGYVTAANTYNGYASSVADKELDCTQSGWGVAPILGFNFNYQDKLNVGVKYEFKTALDVENKTEKDDTGMFGDGVNTPHDIPALLTIGASYKILPQLTASVGYHHFFDSDAEMALIDNPDVPGEKIGKQKYAGSTNEFLFGAEYQINRMFLVSAGGQITKYGVENDYQRDLSFACDSYSVGLGGAVNVSPTVKINIGYFWTTYSDYTKEPGGGTAKDVFFRTNKVFGAGVDFRF
ncbi:MAG: aromatic hydrocarbon degradation protein [Prevotella sp.]|jgi:long-chain fatty acid transport protein|nr:aromatic hydrocarbon degradation protein [Prevotella sp.]